MAERTKEQLQAYFQRTFCMFDEGKVTLQELEKFVGFDEAEFCSDPVKAAFLQGRRSVVCWIKQVIKGKDK